MSKRADIVLSDLDGRWEDVYVQPKTRLAAITAVFRAGFARKGGRCADIEQRRVTFEDFFHIADGRLEVSVIRDPDGKSATSILLADDDRDHECGMADRERPNAIARAGHPNLTSGCPGRSIAAAPRCGGVDGTRLLDERGRPRSVRFASKEKVPNWRDAIWEPDPRLERRLLAEYLSRNHAFRTRSARVAWRPASFTCCLCQSGYSEVLRRGRRLGTGRPSDGRYSRASHPGAVCRLAAIPGRAATLRAHSYSEGSQLGKGGLEELDARVGGKAWSWSRHGDTLQPSLSAACRSGLINWFLLRTLWENGAVAPEPAFYLHTGCNSISPPGANKLPYDHPAYGRRQGTESLLFFANGLALVGHSKVFYDEPANSPRCSARAARW